MTLNDRVVLITGGRRIGQVVARELAREGADIAVSYRASRKEADETVAEVQALGRRAEAVAADVGQAADCVTLVDTVAARLGRLDVLVNMASITRRWPLTPWTSATGSASRHQPAIGLSVREGRRAAHAQERRRTNHQLRRLARAQRAPALITGFVAYYTSKAGGAWRSPKRWRSNLLPIRSW